VVGLVVGLLFGGAIVGFTYWTAPEPLATADLFSRGLNEVLFPVGCSLVLYTATALGKRIG
jgi:predicted phage tail protein